MCEGLIVYNLPKTLGSEILTLYIQKLNKLQLTADLANVYIKDLTEWTNTDSQICMVVTDFMIEHDSTGVY